MGSNAGGVYGTSGPQFVSELRDPNPTTVAFLAACAELGMRRLGELNGPDNTGFSPTPVTQRRGLRHSAADAYLHPVRRRPNLTVLTGAHVQRILFDGARATGVEYRDAAGVTQRVTVSGEVILSGGAVNSPQLLMLSGIGDPEQLRAVGVEPRHELVGVGANLQDHLACAIVVHCPKPVTLFAADSRAQLARFLLGRRGMLTSSINEAVAFVRSDPALAAPDLELVWLPVPVLGEGLTPPPAHGVTLGVELLQPDSRGHIRLASADPAEPPIIDPGYLTAESDLHGLMAGLRIAERVCDTAALRPYVGAPMAPWPGHVDDANAGDVHPGKRPDGVPPRRHLPHGHRRCRGGRLRAAGPRPGWATGRRRLDHAADHPRPHPRPHRHDRRTRRRPHPRQQPQPRTRPNRHRLKRMNPARVSCRSSS